MAEDVAQVRAVQRRTAPLTHGRIQPGRWAVAAAFAFIALVPPLVMVAQAIPPGGTSTGANGFFPKDTAQYLAWIRDAGSHGLVANLFDVSDARGVFLHPMALVSGVLWRLGLPLQLAYLVWLPFTVALVAYAAFCWVDRFLPPDGRRLAAAALALGTFIPTVVALDLVSDGFPAKHSFGLWQDWSPISSAWGYVPKSVGFALLPLALLACERLVGERRRSTLTVAIAVGVSWFHPWQGVELIIILSGVLAWGRFARDLRILWRPIAGALVPLVYYQVLASVSLDWAVSAANGHEVSRMSPEVLAVAVLPIVAIAAAGVRRPGDDVGERMLLLWIPTLIVVYYLPIAAPYHALGTLTFPFGVLAVRGWERLKAPAPLGVLAVAAAVLPGVALLGQRLHSQIDGSDPFYLTADERRTFSFLEARQEPGAIMATQHLGVVAPAFTGRQSWSGHFAWTPDYRARLVHTEEVMRGLLTDDQTRSLLRSSGVRFVIKDCRSPASPPLERTTTRLAAFGCNVVYRVPGPARASARAG